MAQEWPAARLEFLVHCTTALRRCVISQVKLQPHDMRHLPAVVFSFFAKKIWNRISLICCIKPSLSIKLFVCRAFYLCTIVKVSYYFCTIENYKSSSAPSKKLFFPSIPFRPLSSLTVSTIQWDHVVSGQDSYLPPLAPPMAPPTPLSVPGAHTSNSLGVTSSCLHLPRLPTHQPFPAILRVAGPRGGFGRLRG